MGLSARTPGWISPTWPRGPPLCCLWPPTGRPDESATPSAATSTPTWRRGVTDVAIGCSGLRPVIDLRGTTDALGRELQVTEVAVVDELAAAAELVMGKAKGVPVAVVRGVDPSWFGEGGVVDDVVRDPSEDLFR